MKDEINLQPAHVKAYRFIQKYLEKNLYSPNREEVQKVLGMSYRRTWSVVDQLIKPDIFTLLIREYPAALTHRTKCPWLTPHHRNRYTYLLRFCHSYFFTLLIRQYR